MADSNSYALWYEDSNGKVSTLEAGTDYYLGNSSGSTTYSAHTIPNNSNFYIYLTSSGQKALGTKGKLTKFRIRFYRVVCTADVFFVGSGRNDQLFSVIGTTSLTEPHEDVYVYFETPEYNTEVVINKADSITGEAVGNIGFTIQVASGDYKGQYINAKGELCGQKNPPTIYTNSNGKIDIVTELTATEGEKITFKVTEVESNNEYYPTVTSNNTKTVTATCENGVCVASFNFTDTAYSLTIQKTDKESDEQISGAKFAIKYSNDEVVDADSTEDTDEPTGTEVEENTAEPQYTINYYIYSYDNEMYELEDKEKKNVDNNTEITIYNVDEDGKIIIENEFIKDGYTIDTSFTEPSYTISENAILNIYYYDEDVPNCNDISCNYSIVYYISDYSSSEYGDYSEIGDLEVEVENIAKGTVIEADTSNITYNGNTYKFYMANETTITTDGNETTTSMVVDEDDKILNVYFRQVFKYTVTSYISEDGSTIENNETEYGYAMVGETLSYETEIYYDETNYKLTEYYYGNKETERITVGKDSLEFIIASDKNDLYLYYVSDASGDSEIEGKWLNINEMEDDYATVTYSSYSSIEVSGSLKLYGLTKGYYYIYEVGAPTDGDYNLSEQEGYRSDDLSKEKNWVYCGYVYIGDDYDTTKGATTKCNDLTTGVTASGTTNITVTVPNIKLGKMKITKTDSITTTKTLEGAGFKIYAKLSNGSYGWLSGDASGTKSYGSLSSATEYSAVTISKLRYGTYYIYETTAPTTDKNYTLADQEGYMKTGSPGASSLDNADVEWVYIGSKTISSGNTITCSITNRPEGSIELGGKDTNISTGKINSITQVETDAAGFKIYASSLNGATSSGWVSGGANDGNLKSYGNYSSASTYSSGSTISRLAYGTYYIYEVTAPSELYDLRDQDGYKNDDGGNALGASDLSKAGVEWVYIGSITIGYNSKNNKISVSYKGRDSEGNSSGEGTYTLSNAYGTPTIENKQKAQLQIEKVDQEYSVLKLSGAEIIIYADLSSSGITDGWVSGSSTSNKTYADSPSNATTYTTNEKGLTDVIERLNYGTYYIYEIKTPEGYDITRQDGYKDTSAGSWATSISGDWAYLGKIEIPAGSTEEGIANKKIVSFEFTGTNIKKVSKLEGLVWVDNPKGKGNVVNYLYDNGSDDVLKNIEVRLYLKDKNGNYYNAATTYTKDGGIYTFNFDPTDSNNYCGVEVTYWQLVTAYVEFVYDNTEYVVVDPFVTATDGMDITINSKAQEVEMKSEELDDNILTGTSGDYPGLAVTYQGGTAPTSLDEINAILSNTSTVTSNNATTSTLETTPLTGYYDTSSYKISNINLGLLVKEDPEYNVTETLAYAYLTINGFTYIYYYDEPTETIIYNNDDLPAEVLQQVNTEDYSRTDNVSVYASDISSTNAGKSNMQLYLVYSIYVENLEEASGEDDIYNEQTLYLSSLTNTYDLERLRLSTDNAGNGQYTGSDQFEMWTDTSAVGMTATATYSLFDETGTKANDNSVYKNGIDADSTIKTYIQFKVTQDSLTELLQGDLSKNTNKATTAKATGFHEYLRTDNLWNDASSAKEYASDTTKYPREEEYATKNSDGDLYYIHKSVEKEEKSGALYVNLIINENDREISAIVYEDVAEESTYTYEETDGTTTDYTTYVGNGKIDVDDEGKDVEINRAEGVTVELLEATTEDTNEDGVIDLNDLEQATLYVQDTDESSGYTMEPAVTTTNENGEYSFEGVIPGYYYIRFTYGDGSQKIGYTDDDGNFVELKDLTSNDYKSTIINTNEADSIIEDAMKASWPDYDSTTSQESTESELEKYYETGEKNEDAMNLLEWYKYLDSNTHFNTAVDNLNMKDLYNGYEYTEKGIYDSTGTLIVEYVYDSNGNPTQMVDIDGNIVATYDEDGKIKYTGKSTVYPLTIQAYTPEMAISVENTEQNYTDKGDTHANVFDEFDFGIVEQPQTDTSVTKSVVDVELTAQQGSTVLSGIDSTYVTVFDKYQQYLGVELESELIYGSDLEVTYSIEAENTSQYDYIEKKEDEYGTYYKYGTITESAVAKTIEIGEVIDDVDSKYDSVDELDKTTITQTVTRGEETTKYENSIEVKTLTSEDTEDKTLGENTTTTTNTITFTGWKEIASGETITIQYTVHSLLSSSNDTLYTNPARITSLKLNSLTTLTSSYEWGEKSWTELTVYASTGGDMRNILYVVGAISLIVVAFGIILIRKKII